MLFRSDPTISTEIPSDAPVPGVAAGWQGRPAVATDGTDFLVGWSDARSSWRSRIYVSRVRSDGTMLDPWGISLGGDFGAEPSIAFGAGLYLVVWRELNTGRLRGARVATNGNVLDPAGLDLADAATVGNPMGTAIAFDGTNFFAVWMFANGVGYHVMGLRISPSGVPVDSTPLDISGSTEIGRAHV